MHTFQYKCITNNNFQISHSDLLILIIRQALANSHEQAAYF